MTEVPVRRRVGERVLDGSSIRRHCHVGLAFDRFVPIDDGSDGIKSDFFERIIGLSLSHRGNEGELLLRAAHERALSRLTALAATGWETRSIKLTNESRVVTGMGLSHPFDAGFGFSHTLGVPVIAGSAVKGLVRAYAKDEGWPELVVRTLFGPALEDDSGQRTESDPALGLAQFSDLTWREWGALELDILNPHYGQYYLGIATEPGEWMQPVPSFFLTSAPGQKWHTSVLVPPLTEESLELLFVEDESLETTAGVADKVGSAIVGALEDMGGGGKTAVGYGVFRIEK